MKSHMIKKNQKCLENYKAVNTSEKRDWLADLSERLVRLSVHSFCCKFLPGRFAQAEVNCQLAGKLVLFWRLICFVIPPNSNTFSDWRRTCHVPLVKIQWRPRADKTQWRPRATTPWPWTFHLHVIRSCTLKPRQIFEPAIEVAQRFSLEKPAFIIQKKGFVTAKIYQIKKGENLNILCLQAFNLTPKNGPPAFGNSLFDHCRQVGK